MRDDIDLNLGSHCDSGNNWTDMRIKEGKLDKISNFLDTGEK